ncbi:MAG TPA: ParA family protein [Chloroflexota bacterium]
MPIITVANHKGGVGKTTCTVNVGAALQEMGKRVLLVDLDPQGSLSVACGLLDVDAVPASIGDLLVAHVRNTPCDIMGAVIESPSGLDLVPGNGMLSAAEIIFADAHARESMLGEILAPAAARYDYVLIDCLPSLGLMAINALQAASGVVIPVQADFLAVQGLVQMLETISAVRRQLNPTLEIYGIVLTMVDSRGPHARRVVESVRRSLQDQVHIFNTEIGYEMALKESAELGKSVLEVQSGKRAASSYRDLAHEVAVAAGDAPQPVESRHWGVMSNLFRTFGRFGRPVARRDLSRPPDVRAA